MYLKATSTFTTIFVGPILFFLNKQTCIDPHRKQEAKLPTNDSLISTHMRRQYFSNFLVSCRRLIHVDAPLIPHKSLSPFIPLFSLGAPSRNNRFCAATGGFSERPILHMHWQTVATLAHVLTIGLRPLVYWIKHRLSKRLYVLRKTVSLQPL